MGRLGIIACQVLEKELACLLREHHEISRIYIERSAENTRFASLLDDDRTRTVNDADFLPVRCSGTEVLVDVLPAALHSDVDELEYRCNAQIDAMKQNTSAILLFMGLCGNALQNVVVREDVPLVTIEDDGLVDDCIVALLGRKRYMEELRKMGSLFLSHGWVTHWDRIVRKIERDMEGFKMVLRLDDYRRTRYIHTPGVDEGNILAAAQDLSNDMELEFTSMRGSLDLL
ncbi:MAG TPA: DUF1638 domain-containing protein, partial [Methanomicrobia archaeon]|nr:DUF1638 domain-containing protein [Methanomicrobia archaeon]